MTVLTNDCWWSVRIGNNKENYQPDVVVRIEEVLRRIENPNNGYKISQLAVKRYKTVTAPPPQASDWDANEQ